MTGKIRAIFGLGCLLMAAGAGARRDDLSRSSGSRAYKTPAGPPTSPPPYAPGLGDFRDRLCAAHRTKLWLAGKNQDWTLAAYESSELGETFDDVVTYQATWKNVPVGKLVKAMIDPALKKVDAAIAARKPGQFPRRLRDADAGVQFLPAGAAQFRQGHRAARQSLSRSEIRRALNWH